MTTLYYDPVLDVHHRLPAAVNNTTAFYAAPQVPEDARRLWDAACASAGFCGELALPIPAGRAYGSSLLLAREWGDINMEARLSAAIEASYEPTWDTDSGEFTWGLGLNEPHPRGQFNAFLAAAEACGPGMWERLSAAPLAACAQVVDVDFPAVALTRAEWIDGVLHLRVAPLREDPAAYTSFRVVGAPGDSWAVDGPKGATVELTPLGLNVQVPLVAGDLTLRPY
jgi:hypothetical protein